MELNSCLEKLKQNESYIYIMKDKIKLLGNKNYKYILKEIIRFSKENNLIKAYSYTAFNLAKIYIEEAEYECADRILEELYELFHNNDDINGVLDVITGFIATKFMSQKYIEAIEWASKGVKLAKEYNNVERLLIIKNNICVIYIETGQYLSAIKILDEIEKAPWLGSKENEITLKINRIFCEIMNDNLEKALEVLDSIKESVKINPMFKAQWLIEKSKICIRKSLYLEAKEYLLEAETIVKEFDFPKLGEKIKLCLADIYIANESYKNAINILRDIESKVINNNIIIDIKNLYYKLSFSYKNIDDFINSEYYFKKYSYIQKYLLEIQDQTSIKMLDYYKEKANEVDYKKLYEENILLLEFGKKITNSLDKYNIFNVIAEQINKFIAYDNIYIALYDEKIDDYRFELIMGNNTIVKSNNNIVIEDSVAKYSIRNKEALLINDISKEYGKYIINYKEYQNKIKEKNYSLNLVDSIKSMVLIPLIVKEKVIGTITIQKQEESFYKLNDLVNLKTLSTFISIALDNSSLYKKLEYNASYDGLTDVYNRRSIINNMNKLRESLKYEENYYIAMIDVDNFKNVNDVYGHEIGDKVLINVVNEVKKVINKEDMIGRYGGEEFILLVKDDNFGFKNKLEKIRQNIESLTIKDSNNDKIKITISIGVEKFDLKYKTLEENICVADKKLYLAKNTGKNKVVF